MPTLKNIIKLNDNLSVGVNIHKDVKGVGYKNSRGEVTIRGAGVWTARFKYPLQRAKYKTTGIKYYEDDGGASEREAIKEAYAISSRIADQYVRGIDINKPLYITFLATQYLEDIEKKTLENESLDSPIHMVEGGRSYWDTRKMKEAIAIWRNYLDEFVNQLPKRDKRDLSAHIKEVDPRDYDNLDNFLLSRNNRLAIESRLKTITELRHFLHWCYNKRYIDSVPSIKRPHRGGVQGARKRMRKEITPDMYREIIKHTREKYQNTNAERGERDYAYLFHLFILIMANCGIRVPSNNIEHTRIKWEHVNLKKMTLHRPSEKGQTYDAIILPPALDYWNALKKFYQKHKIDTRSGDVFVHPYTQYYREKKQRDMVSVIPKRVKIRKGDPIRSFKKRWETMAKLLFDQKSGTPTERVAQSERISFASLRAWYITQRLYSDSNIRIEQLARVTGTSMGQIEARYFRLDMSQSYDHLTANAYDVTDKKPEYDKEGYYIGRTTK